MATNCGPHNYAIFDKSTKTGTHENEDIHSNTLLL